MEVLRNDIKNKVIYIRDDWGEVHGIDHDEYFDWYYGQIGYKTCLAFSNKKLKRETESCKMCDSIKVSCRGFTGILKMLIKSADGSGYNLSIRKIDDDITHVMECVKPNEIKFIGVDVIFD